VQVHPDDEYAAEQHDSLGKTEAWYVMVSGEPGEVAVGFKEEISAERFRQAALSGEIEKLLDWRKVAKGDVIFTPAGTVHAIGGGLTVCEVQQNSDITYRLYDYGRPRELHLEHGARVAELGPHTAVAERRDLGAGRTELLACDYFRMEKWEPKRNWKFRSWPSYVLLICVSGEGSLSGLEARAGSAFFVPAGAEEISVQGTKCEWIATYTAEQPIEVRGVAS
jgi:mannose-6-phosphate isomerase